MTKFQKPIYRPCYPIISWQITWILTFQPSFNSRSGLSLMILNPLKRQMTKNSYKFVQKWILDLSIGKLTQKQTNIKRIHCLRHLNLRSEYLIKINCFLLMILKLFRKLWTKCIKAFVSFKRSTKMFCLARRASTAWAATKAMTGTRLFSISKDKMEGCMSVVDTR